MWNFSTGTISIKDSKYQLSKQSVLYKWCRQVILDPDTIISPNSDAVVATNVIVRGRIQPSPTSVWVTCTIQPVTGVSIAQVVIPHRLTDIPVRNLNVNSDPIVSSAVDVIAKLVPVKICEPIRGKREAKVYDDQCAAFTKIVDGVDRMVPEVDKMKLLELLEEFSEVFALNEEEIGRISATRHGIYSEKRDL